MKTSVYTLVILLLLPFLSCKSTKNVSKTGEIKQFWINSNQELESFAYPNAGGTFVKECYQISKMMKPGEMGMLHPEKNWESFCGDIDGLDYEKGNFYKVQIKKVKHVMSESVNPVDMSEWELVRVLEVQKDVTYERLEEVECWIDAKQVEARCASPMSPPDCRETRYQYQKSNQLQKDGVWEVLYDFVTVPGYQPGNYYKIKYTRKYYSEMLPAPADGPSFEIEGVTILEMKK